MGTLTMTTAKRKKMKTFPLIALSTGNFNWVGLFLFFSKTINETTKTKL